AATTRAMPKRCWERASAIRQSTRTEVEASTKQLVDEVDGIVRDGVAPPGDVLVGTRKNEFPTAGRLRFVAGNIDDPERHGIGAHRVGQWRNRYIRIVSQKRVTWPERVIDRPSAG